MGSAGAECFPGWQNDSHDPGLKLFALARPLLPPIKPSASILEIGCKDTNWLQRAKTCQPDIHAAGIDWREMKGWPGVTIVKGDVLYAPFAPASCDVIVGLSSLEHIGLGHYLRDPKDPEGDIKVARLIRNWLTGDGWCYFDVPYDPTGYRVQGSECRVYDQAALQKRFGPVEVLGYTETERIHWIPEPTTKSTGSRKFYYVACLMHGGT